MVPLVGGSGSDYLPLTREIPSIQGLKAGFHRPVEKGVYVYVDHHCKCLIATILYRNASNLSNKISQLLQLDKL